VNAALFAAAQVVGKAMTFVWTVVAARELSQRDFGSVNFALSLGLITFAVAQWGFDPALIRRGSAQPHRMGSLYSTSMVLQMLIGGPLFAAVGLVAWLARPSGADRAVLALVLLALLVDLWSDTARAASAAAGDQASTSAALTGQRVATAALAVPALLLGFGMVGLAGAFLAAYLIGWVLHQQALRRLGVRLSLSQVDWSGLRSFARGTAWMGLSALVLMGLSRADVLILEWLKGDTAVGAYSAAYRLFETTLFLAFAVNSAVFPVLSAKSAAAAEVGRMTGTSIALLAVGYLPLGVLLAVEARPLLDLLYGPTYAASTTVALQWLAPAPLLFAAAYVAGSALTAVDRTALLLVSAVAATVVNLALNLWLVPRYGASAAGFATTAAYGVNAAVSLAAVRLRTGALALARQLVEPALAGLACWVVLLALRLPVLVEVAVGAVVYGVVWLAAVRVLRPALLGQARALLFSRQT